MAGRKKVKAPNPKNGIDKRQRKRAGQKLRAEPLRELREKLRAAKTKYDEQAESLESKKTQLKDLENAYDNGANPEHEERYNAAKEEAKNMEEILRAYNSDVANVSEELESMEGVVEGDDASENEEGESDDTDDESTLFVPPHPKQDVVDLTGSDNKGSNNVFDEEDLLSPAEAREAAGLAGDGVICAWRKQGYSTKVIVSYGPLNARKYERSTASQTTDVLDEENVEKFGPGCRLGDVKVDGKYARTFSEFKSIQGIAFNGDLEGLRPKEKGEKRRYELCEIKVKWEIAGEVKRTWEVRSSIEHLWKGNKTAFQSYIYEAAKYQEKRHQEWRAGERGARERSATVNPELAAFQPDEAQPTATPDRAGRATSGIGWTPDRKVSPSPTPKKVTFTKSRARLWKEDWCEMNDIDIDNIDPAVEVKMVAAFTIWKATQSEP